jgi:hypothetical protein
MTGKYHAMAPEVHAEPMHTLLTTLTQSEQMCVVYVWHGVPRRRHRLVGSIVRITKCRLDIKLASPVNRNGDDVRQHCYVSFEDLDEIVIQPGNAIVLDLQVEDGETIGLPF